MTESLTSRVSKATQQIEDAGKVYSEVKCADSNTMVDTGCGQVPSLRKVLKDLGGYQYKGVWAADTAYEAKDQVKDADGAIWLCIENHTSGAEFDADAQAGKWIAFQVIHDTPVFNRRVIDFGVGVAFGPYEEDGRTLLPRLRIGAVEYVAVDEITESLTFISDSVDDRFDGTVGIKTSIGEKIFSKSEAEGISRQDLYKAISGIRDPHDIGYIAYMNNEEKLDEFEKALNELSYIYSSVQTSIILTRAISVTVTKSKKVDLQNITLVSANIQLPASNVLDYILFLNPFVSHGTTTISDYKPEFGQLVNAVDINNLDVKPKAGDIIKIYSNDLANEYNPINGSYKELAAEYSMVQSAWDNTAVLNTKLLYQHSKNPRIALMNSDIKLEIIGGKVSSIDPYLTGLRSIITVRGFVSPVITGFTAKRLSGAVLIVDNCYQAFVSNISTYWMPNDTASGIYGYGVIEQASQQSVFSNLHGEYCRHVYSSSSRDINENDSNPMNYGGSVRATIRDSTAVGCSAAAYDTHQDARETFFDNITVYSGNQTTGENDQGIQLRGFKERVGKLTCFGGSIGLMLNNAAYASFDTINCTDVKTALHVIGPSAEIMDAHRAVSGNTISILSESKPLGSGIYSKHNLYIDDVKLEFGTSELSQKYKALVRFEGDLYIEKMTAIYRGDDPFGISTTALVRTGWSQRCTVEKFNVIISKNAKTPIGTLNLCSNDNGNSGFEGYCNTRVICGKGTGNPVKLVVRPIDFITDPEQLNPVKFLNSLTINGEDVYATHKLEDFSSKDKLYLVTTEWFTPDTPQLPLNKYFFIPVFNLTEGKQITIQEPVIEGSEVTIYFKKFGDFDKALTITNVKDKLGNNSSLIINSGETFVIRAIDGFWRKLN